MCLLSLNGSIISMVYHYHLWSSKYHVYNAKLSHDPASTMFTVQSYHMIHQVPCLQYKVITWSIKYHDYSTKLSHDLTSAIFTVQSYHMIQQITFYNVKLLHMIQQTCTLFSAKLSHIIWSSKYHGYSADLSHMIHQKPCL